MSPRYIGFKQLEDRRYYQFALQPADRQSVQVVVSAPIALFSQYRVGIQDGPEICMQRVLQRRELAAAHHELTPEDFRAFAAEKAADAERRQSLRRRLHNRMPPRHPRTLQTGHWG
jgi:hypothetical protein